MQLAGYVLEAVAPAAGPQAHLLHRPQNVMQTCVIFMSGHRVDSCPDREKRYCVDNAPLNNCRCLSNTPYEKRRGVGSP